MVGKFVSYSSKSLPTTLHIKAHHSPYQGVVGHLSYFDMNTDFS
jgi:hypothetical protein